MFENLDNCIKSLFDFSIKKMDDTLNKNLQRLNDVTKTISVINRKNILCIVALSLGLVTITTFGCGYFFSHFENIKNAVLKIIPKEDSDTYVPYEYIPNQKKYEKSDEEVN